ncbi:copper-binding protein [Sphingomonas glacialis]|uniref:Copper-binding protein n=1 Tax=Sphingomonas glacialis TaxID=658225 RepID=A0A502FFG8_9SPHN|nr:copper-binding protein [Sphingomonas glacialis]TPG48003.1 copper-binding protein [Sphingomonas glacialis]
MKTAILTLVIGAGMIASLSSAKTSTAMPGMAVKSTVKAGRGSGTVTAIDPKTNKITIQHGPIAALGWKAMTMAFAATPPALLKGVKIGERIDFAMRMRGSAAEVTAIRAR